MLISLLLISNICYSQSNQLSLPVVTLPSPEAMKMTKYISYPVDLSNGLIKISIPLYEIVDGDIRIPITLNYHASGLKPNVRSSEWLAEGWSIHTGPSVTRSINGGADEMFYSPNIFTGSTPNNEQLEYLSSQNGDVALDDFYYSLLNSSGRLYLKRTPNNQIIPVTIPIDPIKVKTNSSLSHIDIIDPKGIQYFFGGSGYQNEDYARSMYGETRPDVPTSWKINKIYSPLTNRSVSFEYSGNNLEYTYLRERDAAVIFELVSGQVTYNYPAICIYDSNISNTYYKVDSYGRLVSTDKEQFDFPQGYDFPMIDLNLETSVQKNCYIKTIRFSGGRVEFAKNENNRKGLTSIRVYDNSDILVKQIEIFQNKTLDDIPLLFLDRVKITFPGEAESENYKFLYNDWIANKNPRSVDKWGYYNGANNTTLVPTINTSVSLNYYPQIGLTKEITIPGGNREPNETAMQMGVLTGIIYPTGGRSDFIYEANRYQDFSGNIKLAGGLRIKQVIEQVGTGGKAIYKNYRYGNGILNVMIQNSNFSPEESSLYCSEVEYIEYGGFIPTDIGTYKERIWSDNSFVNLFSDSGSSVSYPEVVETISSDSYGNNVIGEKKHSFTIRSSYAFKHNNTPIVTNSKNGWKSGSLNSVTETKNTGGTNFQPVSMTEYTHNLEEGYVDSNDIITQWYVYKTRRFLGVDESSLPSSERKYYYTMSNLSNGKLQLKSRSEYTYGDGGVIEESVKKSAEYTYDTYGNIIQETVDTGESTNNKEITTTLYPQDMVRLGRDTGGIYSDMVNNYNIYSIPVEVNKYKDSVTSTNLLTTLTTNYNKYHSKFFAPRDMVSVIKGNTGSSRKVLFNNYDNYGGILEQQMEGEPKEVYLWGYKGQYPVAKVTGSDYNTVKSKVDANLLNNGTESQIKQQLANLRNAFVANPDIQVTTYTYKPLVGMTSKTDPNGSTISYEYDNFGRLRYVKDHNGKIMEEYGYHYKP